MAHEIEFLPVGEGERSGDAIVLRFAYPNSMNNNWVVVVVDGTDQSPPDLGSLGG